MIAIGLFPNLSKKKSLEITSEIFLWFKKNNYNILVPKEVKKSLNLCCTSIETSNLTNIDIAITLGGDGTLLNIARLMAPYSIPVLGINMGHLGFLTEIEISDLYVSLNRLKEGDYFIDKRMMLEAQVIRDNRAIEKFIALNDVVITKGPFARLIRLKTMANDSYIDTYPADGLIVSTPTGSTAYSLSAGGPIINPNIELILTTPICPHTLHSRSIVLSKDDIIKVQILDKQPDAMLTVDGQQGIELLSKDVVLVKRSSYYTRLLRLKKRSFYDVLRKKLNEPLEN